MLVDMLESGFKSIEACTDFKDDFEDRGQDKRYPLGKAEPTCHCSLP